ncbi:TonB-dependent receptor [Neolewinella aurantiaca]|uniref:TonB-dependent receptor n=1 Tax=Neolewinella aurantiaca TaxID=2602767 RepID=A0A5C7FCK9_9BACT|nr:TonB-dependent receptor [Neolewinella aurantiaca]TXF88404.1 TonB-dependent receptor [Neolewinella aurantiaca]
MHQYIILSLSFFACLPLFGQSVNGVVTDEAGNSLPGAYVFWHAGDAHTHTDNAGRFDLPGVSTGDTLHISFIGHTGRDLIVPENANDLAIVLQSGSLDLREIVVGSSDRPQRIISGIDLAVRPVNSSQEILRSVPGLFIGQHAGGGKAEQIFLRGFDIDHGTDIAISVDGMPVNMVSHAHGQGYADLHFLIPEAIGAVDFEKGLYDANQGNFATAGHVDFQTKDRSGGSFVKLEAGSFGNLRTVAQLDILSGKNHNAYVLGEYKVADGPFESPQNFSRGNLFAKYTGLLRDADKLSVSLSHFSSNWDASGQIPERAVASGLIGRFGAIDDTEGGETSRSNLIVGYTREIDGATFIKNTFSYTRYDFELFSNFTFFLDDPEFGDQIRQQESRDIIYAQSVLHHNTNLGGTTVETRIGAGLRSDRTDDSSLANTINRTTVQNYIQRGDVSEDNFNLFADARFEFGRLSLQPGVRLDHFRFGYRDLLATEYTNASVNKTRVSPKLKTTYRLSPDSRLFLNAGTGFHSNDSRLANTSQISGMTPPAYGVDLGLETKLLPRLIMNTALWYLFLEQEFVYVGDAGIVEPSGRTRRFGADMSLRYQMTDWLFGDLDATYSHARSIDDEEGENLIPLAPRLTLAGGLSVKAQNLTSGLRFRFLGDRPANEDYSLTAEGYLVADANIAYTLGRFTFGVLVENIGNEKWNEAQFATESRLFDEAVPVEEIHFTPGAPRSVLTTLKLSF